MADFDRTVTERVRDLILDRGRISAAEWNRRLDAVPTSDASENERAVLCRVAPMAEALYLIVSADHACSLDEHVALRGAIRTVTDGALREETIDSLFDHFGEALTKEGFESRFDFVAAQLSADRADSQAALELAAAVIIVDGQVDPLEREALERLAEQTGVDPDRALALLD